MVTYAQSLLNGMDAGNLPNVLSGGLADQPNYNPTYLDPYTNEVINQETAEGGQTQQQIIQKELYGTDPRAPNATGGAVAQQQASQGGQPDPNVTAALNNRAGRLYDSQYNQLQAQATANAPAIQGQLVNQGVQGLQAQQDVGNKINETQMQVIANQNALRNQVVSQLLGGGGQFAGTLAGSGAFSSNSGMNPQTSLALNSMNNDPNLNPQAPELNSGMQSIPDSQAYNLGIQSPIRDGNGYYGETPNTPSLTGGGGYGLGYSYNGRG